MKDYYDLWAIHSARLVRPEELDAALRATFDRRGTAIPRAVPAELSNEFANGDQKTQQWAAYVGLIDREGLSLDAVVAAIRPYIGPACERVSGT